MIDDNSVTPIGMDEIYVRSLRLNPQQDIVYETKCDWIQMCRVFTEVYVLNDGFLGSSIA